MSVSSPNMLQDLLRDAAATWPDAEAIRIGDSSITYSQLEARSNQVASTLVDQGCRTGDRVGVLTHKSFETYAGIYGILKAGCAYVPLDPRAPDDRLTYILRDCGVHALITHTPLQDQAGRLSERCDVAKLLVLGDSASAEPPRGAIGQAEVSSHSTERPNASVVDADLAYILYTSGSTGVPKGVMISHLNSMTFVKWSCAYAGLQAGERVSGHAPLHFDLSIFDVYATAMAGAVLCPVPQTVSMFPASQAKWLQDNKINVCYAVPSALSMMAQLATFEQMDFPDLRLLIFAGEVFPVKFLRAWMNRIPHAQYFNWYGPTETNVVTAHSVTARPDDIDAPVPIGLACENMGVFLVSEGGEVVDTVGESGEIFVRGSCVAVGYWGDETKTSGSFVGDSFRPWLSTSVYRTGDLGTLEESGGFKYLGRRDHQIKSRGYRIELGDIEAALNDVAGVAEAVVIPVPDEVIGNRIMAVVALEDGVRGDSTRILDQVAQVLPRYMVPEGVEFRDRLPKTSNGKLDRQSLKEDLHPCSASSRHT